MNRRQVERVAFCDDEAAGQFSAESAKDQLRKNNLRGRRADIDTHARKRDRVELPQGMLFLYVEPVRVVVVIVWKIVHFAASGNHCGRYSIMRLKIFTTKDTKSTKF
jgi:hypothetical protein